MSSSTKSDLLHRLADAVESAGPPLRARSEWKDLDSFHRGLLGGDITEDASEDASEDLVREAEARLDLLALARAEVEHALLDAQEAKASRLREDERLLGLLAEEPKVYIGLIVLGFIFPPLLLLMPFGVLLVLGVVPTLYGFTRMRAVEQEAAGRIWLVLQDRVDQALGRVRLLHGTAIASLLLTGVWATVEILSERLAQR
jgi:hypothetical protein